MPGPYKATLFLNTLDAGWTETYYVNAASLNAAATAFSNIQPTRMAMVRVEVKSTVYRLADLSSPRTAQLFPSPTQAGTFASTSLSTMDPAIAVLARMFSVDGTFRSRHYLRGMPSDQIVGSATDPLTWVFTSAFNTVANAWIAQVEANAIMVRKTAPLTYLTKAISSITLSTVGTIRRAGRPFNLRRGRHLLV